MTYRDLMMRLEVWIPVELDKQIEEQLSTGAWASRSEFLRTVLRKFFEEVKT